MRNKHGGRPYPLDMGCRILVRTELARRDMTMTELAAELGINLGALSCIVNGVRRSPQAEERIAGYFGKERGELFPAGGF